MQETVSKVTDGSVIENHTEFNTEVDRLFKSSETTADLRYEAGSDFSAEDYISVIKSIEQNVVPQNEKHNRPIWTLKSEDAPNLGRTFLAKRSIGSWAEILMFTTFATAIPTIALPVIVSNPFEGVLGFFFILFAGLTIFGLAASVSVHRKWGAHSRSMAQMNRQVEDQLGIAKDLKSYVFSKRHDTTDAPYGAWADGIMYVDIENKRIIVAYDSKATRFVRVTIIPYEPTPYDKK